jgi:hypothetical protein
VKGVSAVLHPKRVNGERENAAMSGLRRFGELDQLDCLTILVAVLLGTVAKQHHLLGLPDWFLEWVSPFLVMIAAYKTRQKITESIEIRRIRGARRIER